MEIRLQTNKYGRKQTTSNLPVSSEVIPVLLGKVSSASLSKTRYRMVNLLASSEQHFLYSAVSMDVSPNDRGWSSFLLPSLLPYSL